MQCGRFFQWPILGDSEGVMMERGHLPETSDALKNTFLYRMSEEVKYIG